MNLSNSNVENTPEEVNMGQPNVSQAPLSVPEEKITEGSTSKLSFNMEDFRDYMLVIVGFGVALASLFLLILPQYEVIGRNNTELVSSQTELNELKQQGDYLEGLVGLRAELEANIEAADQALPSTEDRVPYVLDQLIQIASISNVGVESLSLSGITETPQASGSTSGSAVGTVSSSTVSPDLRNVLIQMSVSGSVVNVESFMEEISQARTLVDITNFQMSTEAASTRSDDPDFIPGAAQKRVNFSLVSYLKADPAAQTIDLASLSKSPDYRSVIEKLNSMDYYEPGEFDTNFGRENPFEILESTPSFEVVPESEPEFEIIDEPDSEGIQ